MRLRTAAPYPSFQVTAATSDTDLVVELPPSAGTAPVVAVELGTEQALGFIPHRGENRRTRLKEAATWEATPAQREAAGGKVPTRRELFEQRKRQRRGKLDVELRRLQKRTK